MTAWPHSNLAHSCICDKAIFIVDGEMFEAFRRQQRDRFAFALRAPSFSYQPSGGTARSYSSLFAFKSAPAIEIGPDTAHPPWAMGPSTIGPKLTVQPAAVSATPAGLPASAQINVDEFAPPFDLDIGAPRAAPPVRPDSPARAGRRPSAEARLDSARRGWRCLAPGCGRSSL